MIRLAAETINTPPGHGTAALIVYVVAAALGGSLFSYFAQLLVRRQTKDKLISEASNEVAEGARTLLSEYRQELKEAREEIKQLRDRIVRLEAELRTAGLDRSALQRQLDTAIERRTQGEIAIRDLQERIRLIEGTVERRKSPRRSD